MNLIPKLYKYFSMMGMVIGILIVHACTHTIAPSETDCKCEKLSGVAAKILNKEVLHLSWKGNKKAAGYQLILKNTYTQQTETRNIDSLAFREENDLYIDDLQKGATYEVQLKSKCKLEDCSGQSYSLPSAKLLVTTAASNCDSPSNLIIENVVEDTVSIAWYALNTQSLVRISIADTSGSVVYQNDYQATPPTVVGTQQVPYAFKGATNLPSGDYVIWLENICPNGTSSPTELGVFNIHRTTGGGGPIVIIEDNIDIYKPSPSVCNNCEINLPTMQTNSNLCIKGMSISLTQSPKQLIVGYKSQGNSNSSCAPTQPNLWRFQSFILPNVVLNGSNYVIALPPFNCLCSNKSYQIKALVLPNTTLITGGQAITQTCTSCQ